MSCSPAFRLEGSRSDIVSAADVRAQSSACSLEMYQVLSVLLLIFSSAYFITNLRLTAADQIYPEQPVQRILVLIPDFTFCSIYTKLEPMEVVRLFAWFPQGITHQDRCFLRCILRKWGLFADKIGKTWDMVKISKYLLSISSEWRRTVEARSAIHLCKTLHNNITTKYGCKNAYNFFYCLYNHGMSFLLTEKDISDYRAVYEALHPYPPHQPFHEEYEEDESSGEEEDESSGEEEDESSGGEGHKSRVNRPEGHVVDPDYDEAIDEYYDVDMTSEHLVKSVTDVETTVKPLLTKTGDSDKHVNWTLNNNNASGTDGMLKGESHHSPGNHKNTRTVDKNDIAVINRDRMSKLGPGRFVGLANHSTRSVSISSTQAQGSRRRTTAKMRKRVRPTLPVSTKSNTPQAKLTSQTVISKRKLKPATTRPATYRNPLKLAINGSATDPMNRNNFTNSTDREKEGNFVNKVNQSEPALLNSSFSAQNASTNGTDTGSTASVLGSSYPNQTEILVQGQQDSLNKTVVLKPMDFNNLNITAINTMRGFGRRGNDTGD